MDLKQKKEAYIMMSIKDKIISRVFIITAVGLAIGMTFGGHLGAKKSLAAEPIKIGASLSLTGKYAWTGNCIKRGYKTWEVLINKQGYSPGLAEYGHTEPGLINGRPVKFIIYDDKSDPATAVKLYQRLITADKVDLVHGPFSSAITKAISPVIERAKMPCATFAGSDPSIWRGRNLKWIVQGMPTTDDYSPGVAEIAAKRGAKTAAIIFEDTSFAIALAESTRKHLENAGIKIVLYEAYPKGITDWTPPLRKAWALRPDVIGIGGYEPDAIGLTKAAQAIKATPKLFYWTVATYSPDYAEAVGDACYGMIGEVVWDQTLNTPGNKEYVEAFEKVHGKPISKQLEQEAMGFAGCELLEIAVKKAGSLNAKAIRDNLFTMDVQTIIGRYKVAPLESKDSGLQIAGKCYLMQWHKRKPGAKVSAFKCTVGNYVRETIWPEENKSADPIYPFPDWER